MAPRFRIWFCIGIFKHRRVSGRLRRTVGALAAVVCATVTLGAAADPAATAGTVTTGPARSLGEPAAARDATTAAVAATSFGAAGTRVAVWTQPAGTIGWSQAGSLLPAGFGSSYDASAAASPGGPLLVVAGTAPPGESCITNGSVEIADVDSRGRLGAPRLVSDQRGTGKFDDRPVVAVGQQGTVWVAWSQGPDADACQDVGTGDKIEVAVSRNGGQTFGAPVAMPADGGRSAFGARLAPLPADRVAVSWTETLANGDQAVLVSVLGRGGQPSQPAEALTGGRLPRVLPGASFYDFPAGDILALPGNRLAVAAPFWLSGRGVIKLAVGEPGGQWQQTVIEPPRGADLLLPALGLLTADDVCLLYAVHSRSGDRLGYDWAGIRVGDPGTLARYAGPAAVTPAPAGPGFYEIGEELSISPAPDGLLGSVVVAGHTGAVLEAVSFQAPAPAATASPPATATPTAVGTAPARFAGSGGTSRPAAGGQFGAAVVAIGWTVVAVLGCAALIAGARRLRRRRLALRSRRRVDGKPRSRQPPRRRASPPAR